MHFSIPDTQELKDDNGSFYTGYNLNINGVFHCTLRFKQLHYFHDQLKKEFGANKLPSFPPKKLLPLNFTQLEERRGSIEKYIQLVSQEQAIAKSEIFNGFLLNAQQETMQEDAVPVSLEVFLMNGHSFNVDITSTDQTEDVHETVTSHIQLPEDVVYYFGLFLLQKEEGGDNSIVRRLQEFESPHISLRAANKQGVHRIVLRKVYWEPSIDDLLMDDRVAMNLLYVQAVSDVERQWTEVTKEQVRQLDSLRDRGSKKEYLRHARTLSYYGYLQFKPCVTDYPAPNTRVIIKIGQKEMVFKVPVEGGGVKEASFKITRMRCWRIGTLTDSNEKDSNNSRLELAFEYLVARNTLQWVAIQSHQAILMSMCLQSMVDELIDRKNGKKIKRPQDRVKGTKCTYLKRDVSHQILSHQTSVGSDESDEHGPINKAKDSVKKLTDRFSNVAKQPTSPDQPHGVMENDAFEGIRDEDL